MPTFPESLWRYKLDFSLQPPFFFLKVSFSRPIVLFIHLCLCIIGFSPMTAYPCMTFMFLIKEQCWLSQVAWPRFCLPAITSSLAQESSEFPVWGWGQERNVQVAKMGSRHKANINFYSHAFLPGRCQFPLRVFFLALFGVKHQWGIKSPISATFGK